MASMAPIVLVNTSGAGGCCSNFASWADRFEVSLTEQAFEADVKSFSKTTVAKHQVSLVKRDECWMSIPDEDPKTFLQPHHPASASPALP